MLKTAHFLQRKSYKKSPQRRGIRS